MKPSSVPRKSARSAAPHRRGGRRMPRPAADGSFLAADYGAISTQARSLYEIGWLFMTVGVVIGTFAIYFSAPRMTLAYLAITVPALIGVRIWTKEKAIGLPIFPIFLVQQALVYSIPVFAYRNELDENYESIFFLSASLTGIFLLFVYAGWRYTTNRVEAKISRLNLSLGESGDSDTKILNLALALLAAALSFHILWRAGFESYFGPLFSLFRTFSGAASMLGALLGGIVVGKTPDAGKKLIFWSMIIALAMISLIDVLLSDASRVILAAVVGISLGKGKPPWLLLIIVGVIVEFLNVGKTDIRERYWARDTNSTNLALTQTPGFFQDWVATSFRIRLSGKKKEEKQDSGHSISDRIDNLQNTLFVVDAIKRNEIPLLKGETYTIIPKLFIPRAVWKGKPRAHLGQAMLNVHFRRQKDEAATHRVYIAWGILPEAIGNFGIIPGPIILGLFMGVVIGWIEKTSLQKRILSVEGLLLGGLLLITAGSYEMVASVLATSTFQFLVAVGAAGFGLYIVFQGKDVDAKDERVKRRDGTQITGKGPPKTVPLKQNSYTTAPISTQPIVDSAQLNMPGPPSQSSPLPLNSNLPNE